MKWILVFLAVTNILPLSSNADKCPGNDKGSKSAPLHHIIEFDKRNKVGGKDCEKKKNASSKSSGAVLGLHGLLHARSQQKNRHNTTKLKEQASSHKNILIEKPEDQAGSKRTSSQLHKLQVRTETISMLHKIVEKHFPGGHLTVDQKIKALKILGKLIKLKKEGKNSDLKKLLSALSVHHQNDASHDSKDKEKDIKSEQSGKKDKTDETDGGDIYANIASGPDVPKLPPAVSEKDPDHAHSNIMPIGLQPMGGGAGEMMNTMSRPNDISDFNDRVSNFQAPASNSQDMDTGQAYQNGFMGNGMGLSRIPSMMDGQGYVRSRMPYPRRRLSGRGWLSARRRLYDDEDDDDDGDDDDNEDDDEEDDDEEVGQGRTRSYVNRHRYYDDDEDDDNDVDDTGEEIEYTRRFDRKDKIAKSPKNSKKNLQKHM
ncbi:uncharacterized protein LOC114538366 [Dendronephthya gigantea]|uniref:uncharacterized protein LOC114538366 n=1 Tax=Dendronephthya gigantea TaxID=151771 RepID=UPI00106AE560|nr:uncharacterized protein LOC114538366 [Dendronephthya gigantea]